MRQPKRPNRTRIDSLEPRQLLAFAVDVNFQPWYTRREADVVTDIGFPFDRNGAAGYGWNHWKAAEMVQRDPRTAPETTLSNYVPFGVTGGEEDVWEMGVANGRYEVKIVAGDPAAVDSYYAFNVEGKAALSGRPSWRQRFVTSTVVVDVTDGRISVSGGEGAYNNKLNSIHIEKIASVSPDAPANLAAWIGASSRIDLSWNASEADVDGYQIQQSENGTDWRPVAYASGTATRHTLWNVDTTIPHHYRIYAFNTGGWSISSNSVRVAAAPTPTPTPDPIPDPRGYFDGVTVNPEYDPYAVAAALRTLGVNSVRIWGDIEWNKHVNRNFMDAVRTYHNLGFHVTLLITDDKVPTYEQAKAYFNFAVSQPGMIAAVDRWEIINEPNFRHYWTGTMPEYVNNVLKPAYEVLKANGELVVGAAAGVFVETAQALKDAGYLNYVDFANYHPYGIDAAEQIQRIEAVKRIFAGKPLTMTEWNLLPYTATNEKWIVELNKVRNYVVQNVESAYYFHLTFTADWGSNSALFKPSESGYVPNSIFFQMYDNWNIRKATTA